LIASKSSLPSQTNGDVAKLIAKENAVVADLNAFKKLGKSASVAALAAKLKADENAQSLLAAGVNADLSGPSTASQGHATLPGIGSTLTVLNQDKQYEAVKLVAVLDPAQPGNSYLTPDSGKRFVGVQLQITNQSNGTDSSDANSNTSVVGSNKQVYSADFDPIAGCTNFSNGGYTLPKGASDVGCVTFQVPTGVTIAKVEYNPNSGFSTNNAIWTLNPPG
jgi:hypothetical protein